MTQPFFSILLPTRDRPHFLKLVLLSLTKQVYKNFEVIISDNYISDSCYNECEFFKEKLNIKYVHPTNPLSMADNYEYALSLASGDYIIALEDKTALLPFALLEIVKVIAKHDSEIINFLFDDYTPDNKNSEKGLWRLLYNIYPPKEFNALNFLKKRLKFPVIYEKQPINFKKRNKIVMGCWSVKLLNRIRLKHRVFEPFILDYTSMALGSIYSMTQSYDFGRPLGLYIKSDKYSNGALMSAYAEVAKKVITESDYLEESKNYCPFKDCWFVQCVCIASDMIKVIEKCGKSKEVKVSLNSLALRAIEEIENFQDLSIEEKNYYKQSIPQPSKLFKIFDKIRGFIYVNCHPFIVSQYLKVNILGRLQIKRYKVLLKHRNFCKSYVPKVLTFEENLDMANLHYNKVLK